MEKECEFQSLTGLRADLFFKIVVGFICRDAGSQMYEWD